MKKIEGERSSSTSTRVTSSNSGTKSTRGASENSKGVNGRKRSDAGQRKGKRDSREWWEKGAAGLVVNALLGCRVPVLTIMALAILIRRDVPTFLAIVGVGIVSQLGRT